MNETGLQSGDRVIALAAAVRTTSLVAGIAAGAITGWLSQHEIVLSAITALGGGVVGYIVGMIIGRVIFPATPGNVVVAKVGASSLPLTRKGGFPGAVIASVLVSVLVSLIMKNPAMAGMWPSLAAGIVIGVVFPVFLHSYE
ncbi:MAG: hypothetical protein ACE5GF_06590 [Thermodesulfobacteriota bacterium]